MSTYYRRGGYRRTNYTTNVTTEYSPWCSPKQHDWIVSMYEKITGWLAAHQSDDPALAQAAAFAISAVQGHLPAILSENWATLDDDKRATKGHASECITALRPIADRIPAEPSPEGEVLGIDLSGLPSGRYAVPGGDTRLKVQIDNVTTGKWSGWVFVKDAAVYGAGRRYGSQRPGQQYKGEIEDALRAILANPMAAAAEYGRLTNTCGMCGRPLEDEESVARGIGPVCIKKFA